MNALLLWGRRTWWSRWCSVCGWSLLRRRRRRCALGVLAGDGMDDNWWPARATKGCRSAAAAAAAAVVVVAASRSAYSVRRQLHARCPGSAGGGGRRRRFGRPVRHVAAVCACVPLPTRRGVRACVCAVPDETLALGHSRRPSVAVYTVIINCPTVYIYIFTSVNTRL